MTEHTPDEEADEVGLEDLLAFIRDSRGFDFTGYKRSSLTRRIRKRMHEVEVGTYLDYRDQLESSAEEFGNLFNTILINVTGFFRDGEAWTYLQREIMPELIAETEGAEEIRVWSAGCASGEEAYSLAIAFSEALGLDETTKRVKIYGTDVDEEALRDARAGLYPAKSLEPFPIELRDRYFERNGGLYAFRPDLRRRVIFGRHDITRDAPISRLDLLVCRNTLMYLNVETQTHVIDRFHFALRPGAFLFLGKAEMLLSDGDRFEVISMRQRMFKRRPGATAPRYQSTPVKLDVLASAEVREVSRKRQLRDLALETAPFAILGIDSDGVVTLVNSPMRTMFGITSRDVGRLFRDLEISYRPVELRSLIEQAYAEHRVVRLSSVERTVGADEVQYLDIHIQPLWGSDGMGAGVTVMFIDTTMNTRLQLEVKRHREELDTAYEELQSTNEELETTNEELQSSIEELETTNEELQSTNEELETTNEELQSGNEELETMNEEMRIRTSELDEARTFLEGVLSSLAAGVVVLDSGMLALAVSYEARSADGPDALRSLRARMAALHRRLEDRHRSSAVLHDLFATRMEAWLAGGRDRAFRPGLMSAVAAAIGVDSATATVRGSSPSAVAAASSDATSRAAYDLEATLGEGPAAATLTAGEPVRVGGTALRERWPLYGPAVAELGVHAVTAVPLQVSANRLGALCVYGAAPAISDAVAAAAGRVADALTHTVLLSGQGSVDELFGEAGYQTVIHQAAGMVSVRCGCAIDDAEALLQARAFADGQPPEVIARDVLRGEIRLC